MSPRVPSLAPKSGDTHVLQRRAWPRRHLRYLRLAPQMQTLPSRLISGVRACKVMRVSHLSHPPNPVPDKGMGSEVAKAKATGPSSLLHGLDVA